MFHVRNYNAETDPSMLKEWCDAYGEIAPIRETIPTESSYVLEIDSVPVLFISIIRTNCSFCYLENYCGNPEFKGKRAEGVAFLIKHLQTMANKFGHTSMITFAYKPKLVAAFEAYGFTKALDGITAFHKGVA